MITRDILNAPGTWAVADQAIVSLGNVLTTVILARALAPADFAAFALVYGAILVLNNLHGALVIYPLLVKGAGSDEQDFRRLTGEALTVTAALAIPQVAVLWAAAWYAGGLSPWVLAALASRQLHETLRRSFGARFAHRRALAGDAVAYLGQSTCIYVLWSQDAVTLSGAFAIVACSSLAAAGIQGLQIRPALAMGPVASLVRSHCSFGRWVLITHLLGILTQQVVPWVLAATRTMADVATFQALATVIGLCNPVMFAVGNLITPAAAKASASNEEDEGRAAARRFSLQGLALVAPFLIALFAAPSALLALVYGSGSPYVGAATGMRLFVLYGAVTYAAHSAGSYLDGIGRSRSSCVAHMVGSSLVFLGIPFSIRGGVEAAIGTLIASSLVRTSLAVRFSRTRQSSTAAAAELAIRPS